MLHRPTLVKLWCVFTGCVARHLVRCTQATSCTTMHGRVLRCCNRSTARQHVAFWFCNSHDVLRCSMLYCARRSPTTSLCTEVPAAARSRRYATCSRQHAADNMQLTTCSRQHAADNMQQTTCSSSGTIGPVRPTLPWGMRDHAVRDTLPKSAVERE